MSKCVVRMEMPTGCGSCPIANFGYCSINHKQVGDPLMGYPENRPASCPILCQLPEGHGRLIDADSMEKEVCGGCVHGEHKYANCIDCALANASTIVPAEEERR